MENKITWAEGTLLSERHKLQHQVEYNRATVEHLRAEMEEYLSAIERYKQAIAEIEALLMKAFGRIREITEGEE